MLGASSQFPATAERCFVVSTVLNDLITARTTVVGSRELRRIPLKVRAISAKIIY